MQYETVIIVTSFWTPNSFSVCNKEFLICKIINFWHRTIQPIISGALLIFFVSISNHVEKAMAPHSSTLAWKIPWMEEPGGLQSMQSLRVRHDWTTSLSLFTFMHWRRKWQPTPVFLPGESQGRGSLVGCRLWGRTESDTTEATCLLYTSPSPRD